MKTSTHSRSFPILIVLFIVALISISVVSAELPAESAEIPYQVSHSDRIAVGTVTGIRSFEEYSIVTVDVHEWLKNPISAETINIRTGIGTVLDTEDEPRFTLNETVILMLTDQELESNSYRVTVGEPGKHPLSDRAAIVKEISKAQVTQTDSQWVEADESVNYPPNPVVISNISDYAYDMDGDGKYDYLIIKFNASTKEAGEYGFTADLEVFLGKHTENGTTSIEYQAIEIARSSAYLDESEKEVSISFEGGSIYRNQLYGPYIVNIHMSNESWGFGNPLEYTTKEYAYSDFEMPEHLLGGPVPSREDAMNLALQYAAEHGIEIGNLEGTEILDNRWYFTFEGKEYPEQFAVYGNSTLDVRHQTFDEICIDGSISTVAIITLISLILFPASIAFLLISGIKAFRDPHSGKTWTIFFLIGIVAFLLSGYIPGGLHSPQSIYLMMVIYGILVSIAVIASKDRSRTFIAKAFAVSLAALILISGLFFAMGAYSHMNSKIISAELLHEEPDDFTIITEEELNDYPALKSAIETQGIMDVSSGEWEQTIEFLNGSYNIHYKGKYYGIGFMTA